MQPTFVSWDQPSSQPERVPVFALWRLPPTHSGPQVLLLKRWMSAHVPLQAGSSWHLYLARPGAVQDELVSWISAVAMVFRPGVARSA
jgi:hypothetical protein